MSFSALPGAAASSAIALYARWSPELDAKLEAALERLREASVAHGDGLVQSSSLGVEDMVITDLIARHSLPIAIATLDTGKLHPETLALIPRIQERYGREIAVFQPRQEQVIQFVRREGEEAMFKSIELRKACCSVRKLEPLARMLQGRSAWITGLRREQSGARSDVAFEEDDGQGRRKLSPIADWTWAEVWAYVERFNVPTNPLHDQFMPSIGCEPCTRAIAVGEDFRAGRWWWEDSSKECGLHVKK
ncbi:phosphoadenosine phosphosulfate reductase [Inhella inkyongensis]|uniref:Adenosine 5'-phosphosulfate reductase n=1 Tax=Inhella inkyongensis TaxID=392593 RepID=A0A840S3B5_9BURK|nr:phosphoadenylyl-sulfate reductase [Inhella inkyongensis]MBB5203556.1 phosphoadenosine phosphosulfate reductase [Inhella inkyongensis]